MIFQEYNLAIFDYYKINGATTLSIKGLFATLSINDFQHNNTLTLRWVSRFICCYADCRYGECHYAECHYAEYRGANKRANHRDKELTPESHSPTPQEAHAQTKYKLSLDQLSFLRSS